jgi:hypothetical protein
VAHTNTRKVRRVSSTTPTTELDFVCKCQTITYDGRMLRVVAENAASTGKVEKQMNMTPVSSSP